MDAVCDGRSDGFRMRQVVGFGDWSTGRGKFGTNVGYPSVTNGEFVALQPLPKSLWDFLLLMVANVGL